MTLKALKPAHRKAMFKAAKQKPVSFAFGGAEGQNQLALDDELSPKDLAQKFKTETGAAKVAYGLCRVEGSVLRLDAERTLKDLRGQITELAKSEGWPVRQAKLGGDEGGDTRGLILDGEPGVGTPRPEDGPLGANRDTPLDVRPAEVIAGASGVQYTAGEVTNRTALEGGDYASGARANATENDHRGVATPYSGGTNPMQSANLGGAFAVRHGVGFLCVRYTGKFSSLEDIAEYAKPNSAYLRAFKGLDRSEQYRDPKSADILARLKEWIALTAKATPAGHQSELVVSFQGHGMNGSIYGVDEVEITASKLIGFARAAAKARVSLTLVLDGCFTGNAVAAFQDDAADLVERLAEAGQGARASAIRQALSFARELTHFSRAVGGHGLEITRAAARAQRKSEEVSAWELIHATNARLAKDTRAMDEQWAAHRAGAEDLGLPADAVDAALRDIRTALAARGEGMSFDPEAWVVEIGRFQDRVSDAANAFLRAAADCARAH
jgi:hypothetical protein